MKNLILITALLLGFQNYAQSDFDTAENNQENNLVDPNRTDYKIIQNIPYTETEEEFDLDFDTSKYLPTGFNPAVYYGDLLIAVRYIEKDEAENLSISSKYQILSENDRKVLDSIDYIKMDELAGSENVFSQSDRNFMKSIQFIESTEI